MTETPNFSANDFVEYLRSTVQLNALDKMTQELDRDLSNSQNVMMEIKALYNTAINSPNNSLEIINKPLDSDDISNFLDTSMPNILLHDMSEDISAVDLDNIIASLKTYVEDIKNNIVVPENRDHKPKEFTKLDVSLYVNNLDQLSRRLTDIKLNKKDELLMYRNIELEDKLTQLCNDVKNFTTMIEAKTALCNSHKKLDCNTGNTLQYNNIISKLLSSINELTYMLQNRNRNI